jgi:hypothetical protein
MAGLIQTVICNQFPSAKPQKKPEPDLKPPAPFMSTDSEAPQPVSTLTAVVPLEIPSPGQHGPPHNFYSAHPSRHCLDDCHRSGQSSGLNTNDQLCFRSQRPDDPVMPFVSLKLEQAATDASDQCMLMAPNSSGSKVTSANDFLTPVRTCGTEVDVSSADQSKGAFHVRCRHQPANRLQSAIASIFQPKLAFSLPCVVNGQLQHNSGSQTHSNRWPAFSKTFPFPRRHLWAKLVPTSKSIPLSHLLDDRGKQLQYALNPHISTPLGHASNTALAC